MTRWLRRVLYRGGASASAHPGQGAEVPESADTLWSIVPPDGVKLVSRRPSKTGQGGRGVVARYSDGTTASAMVNSDGSVTILFFRDGANVPAIPVRGGAREGMRFSWTARPTPTP